jgi:hypothetical protein
VGLPSLLTAISFSKRSCFVESQWNEDFLAWFLLAAKCLQLFSDDIEGVLPAETAYWSKSFSLSRKKFHDTVLQIFWSSKFWLLQCLEWIEQYTLHQHQNIGNPVQHNFLLIKHITLFYNIATCFGSFVKKYVEENIMRNYRVFKWYCSVKPYDSISGKYFSQSSHKSIMLITFYRILYDNLGCIVLFYIWILSLM